MDFIPTEVDTSERGAEAEQTVWSALKNAFETNDRGIAYHKFPVVDKGGGAYDREPDFVLLHQDLGLIVIECKGYLIEHIESIQGQVWKLQDISFNESRPYAQARDQGFRIRSYFTRKRTLTDDQGRCKIPVNVFVALPNISRDEWESRGFHNQPAAPRTLTQDELSPKALRKKLDEAPSMESLTDKEYRVARSVLGGGTVIENQGSASPPDPKSKGDFHSVMDDQLAELDKKQEEIGIQIPPGPQQVRGIAGSGKTILIAMKAARMHSRHPEWDIAVTFMTKSLYPQIREYIHKFYYHFTEDEPNWSKLRLLHGWGGRTVLDGMYYVLAEESGEHEFLHAGAAREKFGKLMKTPDLLDSCCEAFLETDDVPKMFDAVLIDEAQDFQPAFYKMCRAALREPERLIWAYDEAQSLGSLTAPSPTNIFGRENGEPVVDLRGSYENGIQKSQIMRKSYRSPRQVLMTAHYFGMGLKREDGAVQAITTQDGWENIGYEVVEGDFRKTGEQITIRRPEEYSPHPLNEYPEAAPFVQFESVDTKREEMERVAQLVRQDIFDEELAPEEVMIVLLGQNSESDAEELTTYLDSELGEDIDLNCVWDGDTSVFKQDGEVTVTRINRAKGNEAGRVYLTGLEYVAGNSSTESLVQRRNQAFVGITRTRGWCTITGVGESDVFEELRSVIDDVTADDPKMTFSAPDPQSLEKEMESDLIETTLDNFAEF